MLQEVTQRESLPYPIGLHRIVCYGDHGLYLIGGATYRGSSPAASSSSNSLYDAQMYKFNLSTKKWTKMASIVPTFTDDHASMISMKKRPENSNIVLVSRCTAFLDRRRLMIAGGRLLNSDFNVASYSTYVYDVVSQTTKEISTKIDGDKAQDTARLPIDHRDFFDQTLLKWNDSFVVCSRILDEQTGRKRFVFHLLVMTDDNDVQGESKNETNVNIDWQDLSPDQTNNGSADEPVAGDLCELAIHDGYVYCIDKNDIENCLDVQWRYDLHARRWECVDSLADPAVAGSRSTAASCGKPVDRMFTSCVTYGDSVYVVGGSAMTWAGPKSNPVLADIWRLHLPTLQWTLLPVRLPEGLWFHSVDVSPSGCMYIFGGFTDLAGRKPTRKLWRVYLEAPPSLSSLCWRTVLKAGDFRLEKNTDDELRDMRVPLCFVSALRW